MAIASDSEPAPALQPRGLLRRPELPLDPLLAAHAPLPSLTSAFSRRRAIFGAVAAAAVPAGILRASAADIGRPTTADARLATVADELHAVEAACNAHTALHRGRETDASEAEFEALVERYGPLEDEMAETPSDTLAGILAKVRALQVPCVRDGGDDLGLLSSIADDIARLHAAGGLV